MLRKCFRGVDAKNNFWCSPKYYDKHVRVINANNFKVQDSSLWLVRTVKVILLHLKKSLKVVQQGEKKITNDL